MSVSTDPGFAVTTHAAHHRTHAVDNVASLRLYASGVCLSVLVPRAAGARTREARALPTGCYC